MCCNLKDSAKKSKTDMIICYHVAVMISVTECHVAAARSV